MPPSYMRWMRPVNMAFIVGYTLAAIGVGASTASLDVRRTAYWLAAALLLRMVLHECGHLAVGVGYRSFIPDPSRITLPRIILRLGPRGTGWSTVIGRFGLWLSPYGIIGPGLAWVAGESRFPARVRVLHILAGPLAEAIPSTVALIAIQAVPKSEIMWFYLTLGSFVVQGLALINLVAIAKPVDGVTGLTDGAELARVCLGLSRGGYVALPRRRQTVITLITAILVVALMSAEVAACGLPTARDVQQWRLLGFWE